MYESFIIYIHIGICESFIFRVFVDEFRLWLIVGNWNQGVWVNSAEERFGMLEVVLGLTFFVTFSSVDHIQVTQLAVWYPFRRISFLQSSFPHEEMDPQMWNNFP